MCITSSVNLNTITASLWIKQKNPTKYFDISQSKKFTWGILAGQLIASVTIFGLWSLIKCSGEKGYFCNETELGKFGGLSCVICLIILLKITAENHGITSLAKLLHLLKKKLGMNHKIEIWTIEVRQQGHLNLIVEDQGLLICFGGFFIGVIGGLIRFILVMTFEVDFAVRQLIGMINLSCIPIFWIYKSEKLQKVVWKCLFRRRAFCKR